MNDRASELSRDEYWAHRSKVAERRFAKFFVAQQAEDNTALERFVAWGLDQHLEQMLAWAREAVAMSVSAAYVQGWEQVLRRWQDDPDWRVKYALSWLIVLWADAR